MTTFLTDSLIELFLFSTYFIFHIQIVTHVLTRNFVTYLDIKFICTTVKSSLATEDDMRMSKHVLKIKNVVFLSRVIVNLLSLWPFGNSLSCSNGWQYLFNRWLSQPVWTDNEQILNSYPFKNHKECFCARGHIFYLHVLLQYTEIRPLQKTRNDHYTIFPFIM